MGNWNLKLMTISFLSLTFFLSFSCSSIEFKSNDKINLSLDKKNTHEEDIEIKVDKDFFLLGFFPKHEIFIDDYLVDKGATEASSITIENHYEFKNSLWALFTFGVYYPQTYKIKAKFRRDNL